MPFITRMGTPVSDVTKIVVEGNQEWWHCELEFTEGKEVREIHLADLRADSPHEFDEMRKQHRVCCQHARRTGHWDERAGGMLHCPTCGKPIAKFRQ